MVFPEQRVLCICWVDIDVAIRTAEFFAVASCHYVVVHRERERNLLSASKWTFIYWLHGYYAFIFIMLLAILECKFTSASIFLVLAVEYSVIKHLFEKLWSLDFFKMLSFAVRARSTVRLIPLCHTFCTEKCLTLRTHDHVLKNVSTNGACKLFDISFVCFHCVLIT